MYSSLSSLPRFRQHHSIVIPKPGDLNAALDACKVADSVLFIMSPESEVSSLSERTSALGGALGLDATGETLLSAIMAQGLPSPVFVLNDIDTVPLKKRGDYKKVLQKQLERICPIEKLFVIEKENDVLRLLHQIGSQKQRAVFQRDLRSHILSEASSFKQNVDDATLGTLTVDGYVRYQPLNVNGLVHIPGWGDFQMERMEVRKGEEFVLLEEADAERQETLVAENEPDPMSGEQTWPYQEEMDSNKMDECEEADEDKEEGESKKKLVPKGTSEYQAAWIKDDEDDDDDDDNEEDDDDQYEDMTSDDESDEKIGEDDDDDGDSDEMESVTVNEADNDVNNYDKKVSFADDEEEFNRLKGIHNFFFSFSILMLIICC